VIFVFGIEDTILTLSLRISGSFHFVILPARILASVVCFKLIDEPKVLVLLAFFKLIGNVIAPPTLGIYSQSNVGSPDENLLSVCPKTNDPFAKLPLPAPDPTVA
jgi:hypothetical protein